MSQIPLKPRSIWFLKRTSADSISRIILDEGFQLWKAQALVNFPFKLNECIYCFKILFARAFSKSNRGKLRPVLNAYRKDWPGVLTALDASLWRNVTWKEETLPHPVRAAPRHLKKPRFSMCQKRFNKSDRSSTSIRCCEHFPGIFEFKIKFLTTNHPVTGRRRCRSTGR